MSTSSAAHWVKFFNACGIPSPMAATYAHIFVENRIQSDMLMDLNKEYLREMGITPMGDIIAILRHAKHVNDQHARDKVLTSETSVPIAAVAANLIGPKDRNIIKLKPTSTIIRNSRLDTVSTNAAAAVVSPFPKQTRRVLPEHEGKYKIKLPSGSTDRSKEILAKRAKLYSDRESNASKGVFDRLAKHRYDTIPVDDNDDGDDELVSSSESPICVQVTGSKRTASTSSSIFSRLGDKTDAQSYQIKPILKNTKINSSVNNSGGIVKAKHVATPRSQNVMLVKKVPLKRSDSSDDYSDDNDVMECDVPGNEKIVKFASTAEVREIAPAPSFKRDRNISGNGALGNIKSRLGIVSKLHNVKKTYSFKTSPPKAHTSPVKGKTIRMKSDELLMKQGMSVHRRLGSSGDRGSNKSSTSISSISRRIGKVKISNNDSRPAPLSKSTSLPEYSSRRHSIATGSATSYAASRGGGGRRNSSSVFDRLGYNKSN